MVEFAGGEVEDCVVVGCVIRGGMNWFCHCCVDEALKGLLVSRVLSTVIVLQMMRSRSFDHVDGSL